ncbi:putative steroid dehydrogenase [Massariosphaeria phaeospora]|uniref:Putative steroid dehydrogenase n=1 Tax=Massariosphaeria phaeospora TaxID=100035 RepID=A0A7C8M8J5_9PLEO|nr:putative steroid dehydrogenase [Massariosphaeria phaeospora]
MGVTFSQFFPPSPPLTEANISSQQGKVFIVTGGASGIGFELCRILYQAGGKVYLAGRSEEKANAAIATLKAESATSSGELHFLHVSLDDLSSITPAVESFKARESRLDVLFNNAGVSCPPRGSVSAQGHELQMATNCLGPYLLTQLLLPTLVQTAKATQNAAVRVVWTSSIAAELSALGAPKDGIDMANISTSSQNPQENYSISKIGNWYLASELASQAGPDGVLSVTVNPGNLKSALTRHLPAAARILTSPLLYAPVYGAYTELWAGLSSDLSMKDGGNYIIPWGRVHPSPSSSLVASLASKEDGGTGVAKAFVKWCDEQTAKFR